MKDFSIDNSKKLNLVELQELVTEWRKHNFPAANTDSQLKGVVEELGELVHADLKESQNIRKMDYTKLEMDGAGDMIIFLLNYCDMKGFTLEAAIKLAWEEASKRDWIKYPKNGVNE